MQSNELEMAQRFKARLEASLGSRLLELRAFGSRARGLARPDSDLDLMVLVDRADLETRRQVAHLAADQMLEEADPLLLSTLVLDPQRLHHLRMRERRLANDLDREGILI